MWRFREIMPVEAGRGSDYAGGGWHAAARDRDRRRVRGPHPPREGRRHEPDRELQGPRSVRRRHARRARGGERPGDPERRKRRRRARGLRGASRACPRTLFIPEDTPEGVARRCVHYGADIVRASMVSSMNAAGFPQNTARRNGRLQHLHPQGAVPDRGEEDDDARDRRSPGLARPRCDRLSRPVAAPG